MVYSLLHGNDIMKTSIELPDALLLRVRKFNKTHAERPINISAVCRIAIEKILSDVEKNERG